jgi:hypothetical protein
MLVNRFAFATGASQRDNRNYPTLRTAQLKKPIFFSLGDRYKLTVNRLEQIYTLYAVVNREDGSSLRFETWPKGWPKPSVGKNGRVFIRVDSISLA